MCARWTTLEREQLEAASSNQPPASQKSFLMQETPKKARRGPITMAHSMICDNNAAPRVPHLHRGVRGGGGCVGGGGGGGGSPEAAHGAAPREPAAPAPSARSLIERT